MIRNHSHYSIKRAYGKPKDIAERAKEAGYTHYAITDYGGDMGYPYIAPELKKQGIKPVYGIEFYIAEDMTRKGRPNFEHINCGNDTLILLAKNNDGYRDLLRMSGDANRHENFFIKPRLDYDYLLEQDFSNLICIMPYDFSTITRYLTQGEEMQARRLIRMLKELFGEDFYFEISSNKCSVNKSINIKLIEFALRHDIKMVGSSNAHYPKPEDKDAYVVLDIMGQKKSYAEKYYELPANDHYMKTKDEIKSDLLDNGVTEDLIENMIDNIDIILSQCEFELKFPDISIPNPPLPMPFKSNIKYLEHLMEKGWEKHIVPRIDSGEWDSIPSEMVPVYKERLDYEYNMIKNIFTMRDPNHSMKEGFVPYILVTRDYVTWAKGIDRRIMHDAPIVEVGPARGSVSGSLLCYVVDLQAVDPMPWGLTFERFINPERVSWPDIDMDFDPDTAFYVELYLIETYGFDNVAHILTFQTLAAKNSWSYISKTFTGNYGKYKEKVKKENWASPEELKKLIPMDAKTAREIQDTIWADAKLSEQLDPEHVNYNEKLGDYYKLSSVKKILDIASKLEGSISSTGTHPGAVIIADKPLWHHTSRVNAGTYGDEAKTPLLSTSYEKYALEDVQTMKYDILRLRELTIVRDTLKFIKESTGEVINLDKINPFDIESNLKILRLMKDGDLDGVFQFSSKLYKQIIEEVLEGIEERGDEAIAKDLFNIIVALEALGRPGPLEGGMVPTFAAGLANPDGVEKVHDDVDTILSETFGNMLYQEQLMFILQKMGGFSLGQADMVRRGIASGKLEKIEEQRQPFLEGVEKVQMKKNPNTTEQDMEALLKLAHHIFDLMAKWAGYGFNKAHSVGYGFLSLRGAWLKANYKPHFMASLISANSKDEDKVIKFIDEIRARGISVMQPKINKSNLGFTVVGEDILFGLKAISGVGDKAIENIIAGYPYENYMDFLIRSEANKTAQLALIKAGYFEEDKGFLMKYWQVFKEIKEGKTKKEEALLDYIEETGITELTQEKIEKRLEDIIVEKASKKRTDKTRNECLNLIDRTEYSSMDLLTMEKEVLGMYLSESPLDRFQDLIYDHTVLQKDIRKYTMKDEIYIVGMLIETPPARNSKNGDMAFPRIQMLDGLQECVMFADSYKKYKDMLIDGNILIMNGKKGRGGSFNITRCANLVEKEQDFRDYFAKENSKN